MKTIAVASGKGGVGKSTIAALLALAYAEQGMRVALLDADLYGPSLPTLFNLEHERHSINEEQKIIPIRKAGIEMVSFGFILGGLPAIMRGPMIARYTEQLYNDVHWGDHDVLIIDLPPGTGDIHLTITQSHRINAAIIVTTPHALSFSDVGKAMLMLNKVQVPIIGIVANMAYFICAACHTRHNIFGEDIEEAIAARFGVSLLALLPLDQKRYSQRMTVDVLNDTVRALAKEAWSRAHATNMLDIKIENSHREIAILLSNGEEYRIAPYRLRTACRCAICYDEYSGKRRALYNISKDVFAEQIKSVGNYALYIKWSDGHASGFFPLDYIRSLLREGE